MNIFKEGNPQNIEQVLAAKDQRVALQKKFFDKYPNQVLVDIKMNIPGPIKNNQYLRKMFALGISKLESVWKNLAVNYKLVATLDGDAGSENFYVLSLDVKKIKLMTIDFEDQNPIGRLFDADVLVSGRAAAFSRKDLGKKARRCFLCDRPAKDCARSRRHSVSEMQGFISNLYSKYVADYSVSF